MRNFIKAVAAASIIATGVVAGPALYAQGQQAPSDSRSGHGMMQGGMMGQGGMNGMMGMMKQMTEMMDQCSKMMSGHRNRRDNDPSDPKSTPREPKDKG